MYNAKNNINIFFSITWDLVPFKVNKDTFSVLLSSSLKNEVVGCVGQIGCVGQQQRIVCV